MGVNVFAAYRKAHRVIDSCQNIVHLNTARRYCNLFFESQSKPLKKNKYNFTEYVTNDLVAEMYERLLFKLVNKETSFDEI